MTTNQLANVPLPAGAVRIVGGGWEHLDITGLPVRYFDGTPRGVELDERHDDIEVLIAGTQYADGRVQREIMLYTLDTADGQSLTDLIGPLTLAQARQLAAALTAAADEADGYDQ